MRICFSHSFFCPFCLTFSLYLFFPPCYLQKASRDLNVKRFSILHLHL
uniref:Uncharacterized protein n=1 Tax=Anguilla anguilla TaxID=7936 RepID=A0A0E9QBW2_ANGAN